VLMLEHSIYSVISPEGCASILWRTADKASDAATAMQVTAQHLKGLGVIDGIVPEPVGGAHRDPVAAIANLAAAIEAELASLDGMGADALRTDRADKFLAIGA
jgi:acetyl-CoA carboxylase carboxyl transferase subunit alpha